MIRALMPAAHEVIHAAPAKATTDMTALDKAVAKASAALARRADDDAPFMGLEKP